MKTGQVRPARNLSFALYLKIVLMKSEPVSTWPATPQPTANQIGRTLQTPSARPQRHRTYTASPKLEIQVIPSVATRARKRPPRLGQLVQLHGLIDGLRFAFLFDLRLKAGTERHGRKPVKRRMRLRLGARLRPTLVAVVAAARLDAVGGGGGACSRPVAAAFGWTLADHALVPGAIVFQGVQDLLTVRMNQVGPRFPQRMDNVVDKSNLRKRQSNGESRFSSFTLSQC